MKHLILCCISILFISVSHGQYTIESVPNNKRSTNSYISDPELVLDKDASIRIDAICQQVEDSVGAQIAVVILNQTNEAKQFTLDIEEKSKEISIEAKALQTIIIKTTN